MHITLEKRDSNVQLRMYVKRTKLAYPVKMHSLHKYAAAIHIVRFRAMEGPNACTHVRVAVYANKP